MPPARHYRRANTSFPSSPMILSHCAVELEGGRSDAAARMGGGGAFSAHEVKHLAKLPRSLVRRNSAN